MSQSPKRNRKLIVVAVVFLSAASCVVAVRFPIASPEWWLFASAIPFVIGYYGAKQYHKEE